MDVALAVKPGIEIPALISMPTVRIDSELGTLLIWQNISNWSERYEDCHTIMNFLTQLIKDKGFSNDYRYAETGDNLEPFISGGWIDNPFNLHLKTEIAYAPPEAALRLLVLV